MNAPPRFLYRYYSTPNYIMDVVAEKRLYHCEPHEFNDPFDCRPLLSLWHSRTESEAVWHKFLYYFAPINSSELERKNYADGVIKQRLHRNPSWLREADEQLKHADPIRVCCFSKSPRNTMLWAHYANQYKGVVFQFRTAFLRDAESMEFRGQEVRYLSSPLTISDCLPMLERAAMYKDPFPLGGLVYWTKDDHWTKEDEIRLFALHDQRHVEFEEPALAGIIFGEKCDENLIRKVVRTIDTWKRKPCLFKTSIAKTTFRLRIGKYVSNRTPSRYREQ